MALFGNKGNFLIITFKLTITIFSSVILGVGLHSHYHSSWITYSIHSSTLNASGDEFVETLFNTTSIKPFQICQVQNILINWGLSSLESCPEIAMERYFIVVIILTFAISLGGLLLLWSRLVDMDMLCWQYLEVAYHGISSVLLFAAGIVYIASAHKILTFIKPTLDDVDFKRNLKTQEKIAAGAFAIMQSILYALVAGLIGHRLRS